MDYNNQNYNFNQEQQNQQRTDEQYNQLKTEFEEIKKRDKSNRLIIALLLIVALLLIIFSTYMYTKLSSDVNNSETPNEPTDSEIPNEPTKKEVTAIYCYENKLVGPPGKSEACLQESSCNPTNTIYNKQVIRLSGDSEGVKSFNNKLETLVNDYAWDTDTEEHADYTCNPITEANLITGVTFNYSDEIYQLSDKYIIIRINIDHENMTYAGAYNGVNEMFIFDIENDKEITKQEFIQALKNKYNISIKMHCGDPSRDDYKLRDESNNTITNNDLASKINGAFNTSYNGERLNDLILDMYLAPSSKDSIYKPFRNGDVANEQDEFYQMYLESRCSEQEFMF